MDINFSLGTLLSPQERIFAKDATYFKNIGVDIQFSEYLEKLNEKRQDNKKQKLLADYHEQMEDSKIPNYLILQATE